MGSSKTLRVLIVVGVLFLFAWIMINYLLNKLGLNVPPKVLPVFLLPFFLGAGAYIRKMIN